MSYIERSHRDAMVHVERDPPKPLTDHPGNFTQSSYLSRRRIPSDSRSHTPSGPLYHIIDFVTMDYTKVYFFGERDC